MKVYVVNLKKNQERLRKINESLTKLGIEFERVEAIYGREVPLSEKLRNSSRFWWWCIKGYPMRDGEYGCAMSHLSVYRKMVVDGIEKACVLEDDAVPRKCLPELLDNLSREINSALSLVALISNHRQEEPLGDFALKPIKKGAFADGYVITLPAAKKILEKNYPICCPSDTWTYWRQQGWIELYQAYPEGVNQEWDTTIGYTSDVTAVGDMVVDVCKMSSRQKVIWKFKRAIGMLIALAFH